MADCPVCAAEEHAERMQAKYALMNGAEPCPACRGTTLVPDAIPLVACPECHGEGWLLAARPEA